MNTESTRRAFIGGTGLAAVALAAPALGKPVRSSVRPAFQAAHDAIGAADQHARAFDPIVDAAQKRCVAMEEAVPHVTFTSGLNVLGEPLRYSTDSAPTLAVCKSVVARSGDKSRSYLADARRLVAADKRRKREIARIHKASGWDAAYDQDVANNEAIVDVERAFLSMPVVSLAELALKVETIDRRECWGDAGLADWIGTDVRRLARGEG